MFFSKTVDTSFSWKPHPRDLTGLTVTVVGGTGGLGRAVTQVLAKNGAQVTVVGRTFRDEGVANISFVKGDLSSIKEAVKVAESLTPPDILLFTAGIFAARNRQETSEGLELDMASSFLNRLAMTDVLAPKMAAEGKAAKPRIFNMGFPGKNELGHPDDLNFEKNYTLMRAHMTTVACNEAYVYDEAKKYPGVNIYGLNPGIVPTGIRDNLFGKGSWISRIVEWTVSWFTQTADQFGEGIAPLLVAPELEDLTGVCFNAYGQKIYSSKDMTPEHASLLMRESRALLKSKNLV